MSNWYRWMALTLGWKAAGLALMMFCFDCSTSRAVFTVLQQFRQKQLSQKTPEAMQLMVTTMIAIVIRLIITDV